MPPKYYKLYEMSDSGHCYKVRLMGKAQSMQWLFFGGASYTTAEIALYAYTHAAHQGGYDLAAYPSINGWMERVQTQPCHTGIGS